MVVQAASGHVPTATVREEPPPPLPTAIYADGKGKSRTGKW
jgi:hypothetical protein